MDITLSDKQNCALFSWSPTGYFVQISCVLRNVLILTKCSFCDLPCDLLCCDQLAKYLFIFSEKKKKKKIQNQNWGPWNLGSCPSKLSDSSTCNSGLKLLTLENLSPVRLYAIEIGQKGLDTQWKCVHTGHDTLQQAKVILEKFSTRSGVCRSWEREPECFCKTERMENERIVRENQFSSSKLRILQFPFVLSFAFRILWSFETEWLQLNLITSGSIGNLLKISCVLNWHLRMYKLLRRSIHLSRHRGE